MTGKPRIAVIAIGTLAEGLSRELEGIVGRSLSEEDLYDGVDLTLESGREASVHIFGRADDALSVIRRRPVDAIVIDNRGSGSERAFSETAAGSILPDLLAGTPAGRAPTRRSIIAILPDDDLTAQYAYAIGSLQLGGVMVDPARLEDILSSACESARPPEPGKVALCLAGGGIEGMFYELGVVRALDAHLREGSVTNFDIFTGISAGALLGAFFANGIGPSEIADSLHGRESRVSRLARHMLFRPNVGEVFERFAGATRDMVRGRWLRKPIDSALRVTPTAMFSGDSLRHYLELEFGKPGLTDSFEGLDKELYIGATDQDSGDHVVFGGEGRRDVPISRAVRASTAMTPYYPPEKIGERYFVDGIFTRNVNLDVAVARGARLVFCVDPMTPVQVDQPGYVSGRGGFFNTVQSVKSLVRTRFSEVMGRAEEIYPDVTLYAFSPTPHDMEQMSGTLMRFFYRVETEEMAFESASQRIAQDFAWLKADLERHGYDLVR